VQIDMFSKNLFPPACTFQRGKNTPGVRSHGHGHNGCRTRNVCKATEVLRHYIHDPELGVAAVQAVRQIDAQAISG